MRRSTKRVVILATCAVVLIAAAVVLRPRRALGEESKTAAHFYTVTLQYGTGIQQFCGSSPLSPDEFAKKCIGTDFVKLENLTYKDSAGKYREYKDWDATVEPQIYLNPKFIVGIQTFAHDPKETTGR
jgi:glutaredoxin-related protein